MILIHYSKSPKMKLRSRRQKTWLNAGRSDKPTGLWVSVENANLSWKDWCEAESFALEKLRNPFRIHLVPDPNLLILHTNQAILDFTEEFKFTPEGGTFPGEFNWLIDWYRIAKQFYGIIISPYSWALRLDPRVSWYYGWDCASGVIWNKKAINRIGQ